MANLKKLLGWWNSWPSILQPVTSLDRFRVVVIFILFHSHAWLSHSDCHMWNSTISTSRLTLLMSQACVTVSLRFSVITPPIFPPFFLLHKFSAQLDQTCRLSGTHHWWRDGDVGQAAHTAWLKPKQSFGASEFRLVAPESQNSTSYDNLCGSLCNSAFSFAWDG